MKMSLETHWCLTYSIASQHYLLRQVLLLNLELTDWLNQLVDKLWVSSCLQFLSPGITDSHYHMAV